MKRVSESLLEELTGGTLAPGTRLADVSEVAERRSVSPSTVRAAVQALVDAGCLVRRDGGVYVVEPRSTEMSLASARR